MNEAILCFQGGKLVEARLLYFNRGDSGALREDEFEELLASISTNLTELTGVRPVDSGRDATNAVKAQGRSWKSPESKYFLEWSVTKGSQLRRIPFRSEFIRLTVRPSGSAVTPVGSAPRTSRDTVMQFAGRDHVERSPGGDVKITDLPMVDQGEKGYCVVASVERVMRYYGASVDQHELAQIANSDAARGTSTTAMLTSLKKLTARLGVKVRSLYQWDLRDFLKFIDDYNRATKRGKLASEIRLDDEVEDADAFFSQMKPEIYKEVRMKKSADFGRFKRDVQRSIEEGIPLLWAVRIGLVREKELPPTAIGGHMRIIIGYNNATNEILYSDSWGMGHEEKRMPVDDAWTITNGLTCLQPLS
ncbi:MAG TPA: hypothetical protein VIT23_00300 [Terrimicrobiaceae bacterium]